MKDSRSAARKYEKRKKEIFVFIIVIIDHPRLREARAEEVRQSLYASTAVYAFAGSDLRVR